MGKIAKRAISIILALAMVLGMVPALAAADVGDSFADTADHWARQSIETWRGHGVMKGYDGYFRPNASITRGEMAQVIANLLKLTKTAENTFTDVENGAWYAEAVLKCAAAGIMVGDGGRFRPGEAISRQESMVVAARALGIKPEDRDLTAFPDGGTVADWAKGYVAAMVEAEIVRGTEKGLLVPLADVSRAEIVTILDQAISTYISAPGTYTLDQGSGDHLVLVVSGGVTVTGTGSGCLVIGAGAGNGTVELKDITADAVRIAAENVKVNVTGKSKLQSIEVQEEARQVVVEVGKHATVTRIEKAGDTQIIRKKTSTSGGTSTVSLQGGQDVKELKKTTTAEVLFTVSPVEATLTAVSSNELVAAVAVDGHTVRVTGVEMGTAEVTVTASAVGYGSASQSFSVTVVREPAPFALYDGEHVPDIYVAADDYKQIVRAVGDLQADVERVTTKRPVIKNTTEGLSANAIIVGSVNSQVIQDLVAAGKLDEAKDLTGKWESYVIKIVDAPAAGVDRALVIAGSDKRGGVYGIYDVSEQIGVSPWYYWGDIKPQVRDQINIADVTKVQGEPSVKYRGIFINDEQNLVQWATDHGPDVKEGGPFEHAEENPNLGPEFYKSVYELLLRLKGNYLWPGMHSETRLGQGVYDGSHYNDTDHFNLYPENRENADAYGIIVGTSHCEPMMRNGTAEWGEFLQANGYLEGVDFRAAIGKGKVDAWMYNYNSDKADGDKIPRYDYSELVNVAKGGTQRAFINKYWDESVKAYKDYEVSYTLGMRGVHDEGFRFANTNNTQTKREVLQDVINAQVKMLEDNNVSEEAFPIFIPYKEVLPLYNEGLELPEDTIIVWADDNYGYNRRFPTAEENEKYAGNGIYYHMSYEGGPTRYQWMNGTPPAQMLSELGKAYESGIQDLWVLNVGDIKPSEIGMEFFLDMAWDVEQWTDDDLQDPEEGFLTQLAADWFPGLDSREVGAIMEEYFRLCYDRRPHHTSTFTFSANSSGDEAMQRLADYQDIAERTRALLDTLEGEDYDVFFALVGYQVLASYYANLKYYYAQRSNLYIQQGRAAAANLCGELIDWAQDQEDALTEYYNTGAFNGKWDKMMQPANYLRGNPSGKPTVPAVQSVGYFGALGLMAEGQTGSDAVLSFSALMKDTHYVDLFDLGGKPFAYEVAADRDWVKVSEPSGTIYDEQRLFVDIDWSKLPAGDQTATLTVTGTEAGTQTVAITVSNPVGPFTGYVEANGYVALEAEHFSDNVKRDGVGFTEVALGHSGGSLAARPMGAARHGTGDLANAPYVTYEVTFTSAGTFPTTLYRIPTLDAAGQRVALQVDNGPAVVFAGGTTTESSGWGSGVQRNLQKVSGSLTIPNPGPHTIKMYMMDPGVCIDRIVINTGGAQDAHLGPRESYHSVYNTDTAWAPKLLSMEEDFLDACIGEVETEIERMGTGEAAKFLQSELEAVRAILAGGRADDTLRRCCARLRSAMGKVSAEGNVDALWAEAKAKADALEASAEATAGYGVPPYDPEAVAAFQTERSQLEQDYAAAVGNGEKLEVYARLMSAVLGIKRNITITAASQEDNHAADKMMDGKGNAGTSGDDRWAASGSQEGEWVLLDLHAPYDLSNISILWFGNKDRTYQYRVETSMDGVNFTTAVDRSGNTKSQLVEDAMAVTARYIRIAMVGKSGGSYSIWEIKLTGAKVTEAGAEALTALRADIAAAKAAFGGLAADTYTIDSYAEYARAISDAEDLLAMELIPATAVARASARLASAPAGLTERAYLLQDTFDEAADLNVLTGWNMVETGGKVELVNENGNKYLKIAQTQEGKEAAGSVEARRSFPETSGKVYIEARVRSDTPDTFAGLPYLFRNNSSTTTLQSLILQKGGEISTYNGKNMIKVGSFQAGEWNTVSLIVDSSTQKMQGYLNGDLVASDLAMRSKLTELGMLRFYSDDKNADRPLAIAYVDDVSVYQEGAGGSEKVKVACVGDSITFGSQSAGPLAEEDKYPAQLQALLGKGFEVRNFGVSGACMLNKGTDKNNDKKGYVEQAEYANSKNYQPDIVVIMLGTNDSKALNWGTGNTQYVADALALIDSYEALPSHPTVYLATSPTVMGGSNSYGIQGEVVHSEIVSLQKQIALAAGAGFIDVHDATKNATTAQFPDKVHGNQAGYAIIARSVYEALTAESKPAASPIKTVGAVACSTIVGEAPALPDYVSVTYSDDTTGIAQAEWLLDGLSFASAGEVMVPGKLKGLADKTTSAVVTVNPPPETTVEDVREAVEAAKKYEEADYTIDSYAALRAAIAAGERAVEGNAGAVALDKCLDDLAAAVAVLKTRDVKFSEDFDDVSSRDALTDWAFVETVGNVTLETDGAENSYLKIIQTEMIQNSSVEAICSFEELSGKIYIQADLRNDTGRTMFAALAYPSAADTSASSKIISGVQLRDGKTDDQCTVKTYIEAGKSSTAAVGGAVADKGEWETLCLILDTDKNTVQVYWNGVKEGKATYPIRNPSDVIGALRFYTDDYNKPDQSKDPLEAYIDNIIVYQEGAAAPQG